ncbi:MAG: hypothetical protein ACAH11_06330 [Sphingomonas sp.]
MVRKLSLALLFGLSACAGGGAELTAGPAEAELQPIVGWRCGEGRILPGKRRVSLYGPVVEISKTGDTAGPYQFTLYKDGEFPNEAFVSWNVRADILDESPDRITLNFMLLGTAISDGELIFESGDGAEIRIPVNPKSAVVVNMSPKSTAIIIEDRLLANRFLRHSRYRVSHRRGSVIHRLEPIELFDFAEAAALYSEMLPALKRKMAAPEATCSPVRAPEDNPADIV